MPTKPANAAANAPMPNQSSTKPDVKISATISIAPRMHHRTHNQSDMLSHCQLPISNCQLIKPVSKQIGNWQSAITSALRKILQYEPDIGWTLAQPAHEVRIPVFSVRNIDSHVETIPRELVLQV